MSGSPTIDLSLDAQSATTADDAWLQVLDHVMMFGEPSKPRDKLTRETLAAQTHFDMGWPIVTEIRRSLGYRFMAAEAWWILSGRQDLAAIKRFAPGIAQYSDNGQTFFGAYGPKVVDQLPNVITTLGADQDTRQAIINIWRENPPKSKDIPCTLNVQWLIRKDKLHCIDRMRSSDGWLGWPYDVFNFTMLSGVILLELRNVYPKLELGRLYLHAGSQHLYEHDWPKVREILLGGPDCQTYQRFNPRAQFFTAKDLINRLWFAASQTGALAWAKEGWG